MPRRRDASRCCIARRSDSPRSPPPRRPPGPRPARPGILNVLRIPDAHVVVTSFDRPNLVFATQRVRTDRERFALIRARAREGDGATLVYAPTRRLTELITRALLRSSVRAAPYHAGLTAGTRRRVLRAFLADHVHIIVATSAFGMGIDKPDVRQVLHWGPPPMRRYVEARRRHRELILEYFGEG